MDQDQACWLGIDTTGQGCHVGLYYRGTIITESDMSPQSHAKRILPMIETLFLKLSIPKSALSGIIYTQGPGSFTGVRVGVSVVQGLSLAMNIPTIGVSSLLLLSWMAHIKSHQSDITAILDARMSQIYWARYQFLERWSSIEEDQLTNASNIQLNEQSVLIGDLSTANLPEIKTNHFFNTSDIDIESLFSLTLFGLKSQQLKWQQELALPVYLRHDVASLPKIKP